MVTLLQQATCTLGRHFHSCVPGIVHGVLVQSYVSAHNGHQQRGFAAAVRSQQSVDLPIRYAEVYLMEKFSAIYGYAQVLDFKNITYAVHSERTGSEAFQASRHLSLLQGQAIWRIVDTRTLLSIGGPPTDLYSFCLSLPHHVYGTDGMFICRAYDQ